MGKSPPYTWKEDGAYQPVALLHPPPVPMLLAPVPVLVVTPVVAVPVKPVSVVSASKSVVSKSIKSTASKSASVKSARSASSVASSSKSAKAISSTQPANTLPGMKYIYPKKNACVHIIKCAKVWETNEKNFKCKVFNVGTPMTVGELIEHLTGKEGDSCNGWSLTEVTEKGDGAFDKGTTIDYGSDKAAMTLAAIGWTELNGSGRPPVWLVIHKG